VLLGAGAEAVVVGAVTVSRTVWLGLVTVTDHGAWLRRVRATGREYCREHPARDQRSCNQRGDQPTTHTRLRDHPRR